jgi:hypothetical protein
VRGSVVLVAPQGFEPRYAAPEAAVLPLNEGATVEKATDPDWLVLKPALTMAWAGRRTAKVSLSIIKGIRVQGQTPPLQGRARRRPAKSARQTASPSSRIRPQVKAYQKIRKYPPHAH